MYRPLPDSVTVKKSKVNGLGLFATEKIKANKTLGITHIKSRKAQDGYWRTPLGGFINHSSHPNCIKEENRFTNNLYLKTIRHIDEGEEITVKYTLYTLPPADHYIPGVTERPTTSEKLQDELEPIEE